MSSEYQAGKDVAMLIAELERTRFLVDEIWKIMEFNLKEERIFRPTPEQPPNVPR